MVDSEIERYLAQPPYLGRSHARDNALVKQMCGPTAKFDPQRKMWSTLCLDGLRSLVASKKWKPVGVREEMYAPLMRAAVEARERAEEEWNVEEERKTKERAKKDVGAAKKVQKERDIVEREVRKRKANEKGELERDAKRQKRLEEEAAAAARKPKRDGLEPTPAEVNECTRIGFTDEAIAFSKTVDELGPRSSLSDEGRVLRWCSIGLDHDERVIELAREERERAWGGREVRWSLPEAASRNYATELNLLAVEAAR